MVTPWTIPKLVTWRVKDWASCFLVCKFPIDDDAQMNNPNKVGVDEEKRSMKKKRSKKKERKLSLSPRTESRNKSRVSEENRRLSWPPQVSDEDYIVFCFDEEGVLDVVDDDLCPDRVSGDNKAPRTVSRKLIYDDQDSKTDSKKWTKEDEHETICPRNAEIMSDVKKAEEEKEEEEKRNFLEDKCKFDAKAESNELNQSDGSRGSFAFPILGMEWIGSPVQMPKSVEDSHLKKQKALFLGFQCCRF